MSGYLIDSNILIVSNKRYHQEFFPVVWDFFKNNDDVYMLDRVYNEIIKINDDLCDWAKENYKDRVINADRFVQTYSSILQYLISSNKWTPAGYEQWTTDIGKADPWLIACAKENDLTIITDEKNTGPNGHATDNEPKIPFVAENFGVRTIDFWELLRVKQFKAV